LSNQKGPKKKIKMEEQSINEEYDRYLKLMNNFEPSNYENILDFHRKIKEQFPRITKIAFEVLAIPGSSSDCESIASIAKIVWTERRNKMSPILLEAIVMEKVNEKFYKTLEQQLQLHVPLNSSNIEFNCDEEMIANDEFENEYNFLKFLYLVIGYSWRFQSRK